MILFETTLFGLDCFIYNNGNICIAVQKAHSENLRLLLPTDNLYGYSINSHKWLKKTKMYYCQAYGLYHINIDLTKYKKILCKLALLVANNGYDVTK